MICNVLGAQSCALFPPGLNSYRPSVSAQGGNHQRSVFTDTGGHLTFVSWFLGCFFPAESGYQSCKQTSLSNNVYKYKYKQYKQGDLLSSRGRDYYIVLNNKE